MRTKSDPTIPTMRKPTTADVIPKIFARVLSLKSFPLLMVVIIPKVAAKAPQINSATMFGTDHQPEVDVSMTVR